MKIKNEWHSSLERIKNKDSSFGQRYIFVLIFLLAIGGAIIVQLFRLQVVYAKKYSSKATNQYVLTSGPISKRGTIYFTQKDGTTITAATMIHGYKVSVNPSLFSSVNELYQYIKPYSRYSYDEYVKRATNLDDPYEEVAYRLPKEKADEIKSKKFQGVTLYPESWRHYPLENLGSHVLGFVGFNQNTIKGQYGLERQYDALLSNSASTQFSNFFAEVFSNAKEEEKHSNHKQGDIITTIEPTVQSYVEKSLSKLISKWKSESVGMIIMDPNNGEIIALANLPDFNPNTFNIEKNPRVFSNQIVESVFEIGSVVKVLTLAAGIDSGVVSPKTTYNDTGSITLNTETIYNARKKVYGLMTMQEVLNKSLNTGATFIMQRMGKQNLREYFIRFGFKEKTNIDLPNEVTNLTQNLDSARDIEFATMSFGQGIAVSPVSAVRAFATVLNGGYLVTPHIVRKIEYEDGSEKVMSYPKSQKFLKDETRETMSKMLKEVVDSALLDGSYKLPNHTAGAKTGTAQISSTSGGYQENVYLHTMVGYFPAYDPKFVVFLYNMKPEADDFAAQTLAPTLMDIGQFLVTYYNVPSDR